MNLKVKGPPWLAPESFWNFDSSRWAKSALLFFNFKEGLITLKHL